MGLSTPAPSIFRPCLTTGYSKVVGQLSFPTDAATAGLSHDNTTSATRAEGINIPHITWVHDRRAGAMYQTADARTGIKYIMPVVAFVIALVLAGIAGA